MLPCVVQAGPGNGLTTWLMGDYNQTGVRVGYAWETFEIFGQSYWRLWETENVPQVYGFGVIYDFPGEIDVSQIPIFGGLSEHISIASYIGFQGAIELRNNEDERGYLGPLVGVVLNKFIFDEVDDEIETGTEVQFVRYTDKLEEVISQDEVRFAFFVRFKF
ncbi:MAG TPA: hypothetical protein VMW91_01525 [Desulfosporosinus sp.]|nr:hypothetical protein [Desulfosporosinus sp.]